MIAFHFEGDGEQPVEEAVDGHLDDHDEIFVEGNERAEEVNGCGKEFGEKIAKSDVFDLGPDTVVDEFLVYDGIDNDADVSDGSDAPEEALMPNCTPKNIKPMPMRRLESWTKK